MLFAFVDPFGVRLKDGEQLLLMRDDFSLKDSAIYPLNMLDQPLMVIPQLQLRRHRIPLTHSRIFDHRFHLSGEGTSLSEVLFCGLLESLFFVSASFSGDLAHGMHLPFEAATPVLGFTPAGKGLFSED
ncbi:MAG: hypothetical protein AAGI25_11760 [Bacteroidota bacterium]